MFVDMIVQNVSQDGDSVLSFTVPREVVSRAAETVRLAGQETVTARAASAAGELTRRVRDDAGKTLAGFRADRG